MFIKRIFRNTSVHAVGTIETLVNVKVSREWTVSDRCD